MCDTQLEVEFQGIPCNGKGTKSFSSSVLNKVCTEPPSWPYGDSSPRMVFTALHKLFEIHIYDCSYIL